MHEIIKILIGIAVVFLGVFIGNLLAKFTKEELKAGQIWFRRIVILSLVGAVVSLIIKNDALLFTFLFITMVTSKSIIKQKTKIRKKSKIKPNQK